MDWQLIGYSLACLLVPVAWGVIVVWVSNRIDRRLLGRGPDREARSAARPIEYHI